MRIDLPYITYYEVECAVKRLYDFIEENGYISIENALYYLGATINDIDRDCVNRDEEYIKSVISVYGWKDKKHWLKPYIFYDEKVRNYYILQGGVVTINKDVSDVLNTSHHVDGRKYEARKVISDWNLNFNLGNVIKYVSRAGKKGDILTDLMKAKQYLDFEIEEISTNDRV